MSRAASASPEHDAQLKLMRWAIDALEAAIVYPQDPEETRGRIDRARRNLVEAVLLREAELRLAWQVLGRAL